MLRSTRSAGAAMPAFTSRSCVVAASWLLMWGFSGNMLAGPALAGPAKATIDIGTMVECRDVTSPEFAKEHRGDKIVEAAFRVSVLVKSGREVDLEELHLVITSREGRLRVIDFSPKTELASEVAGDVEVSSSADKSVSLNASLGSLVAGQLGSTQLAGAPGAAAGMTQKNGTQEKFHRLAGKQLVLASGTVDAEHGVFFKWRRSNQVSLEGSREVTCKFVVPRSWRGDWVQASCEILGVHQNFLGDKVEPCGDSNVMVGLYLAGDSAAQRAARNLSQTQSALANKSENGGDNYNGRWNVGYRPVGQSSEYTTKDWLTLTPIFKPHNHAAPANADSKAMASAGGPGTPSRQSMPAALGALRQLSGN